MKCGLVSIIGAPNAGKSTLLNQIIGQKLSIVTPKAQTTRAILRAIYTKDQCQMIFIDTPGIFNPKIKMENVMVRAAWSSIAGADAIILLIDGSKELDDNTKLILETVKQKKLSPIIAFNKSDKGKKTIDLGDLSHLKIFDISALRGKEVDRLLEYLTSIMPLAHFLYNEDEITTAPSRFLATEVTREKLFLNLNEEIPYNLAVDTEKWEEKPDGSAKVYQVIYINRSAHKKIILGKNGSMIKKVGQEARQEISELLDQKIHLFLYVKVKEDWQNDEANYSSQ